METRKILVMVLAVVWLAGGTALAGEWWVDPNGSDSNSGGENDPFATIQHGIDTTGNGDTVMVNEGTYEENVDFNGKAITVQSTDPNDWDVVEATIIDGNDLDHTVRFDPCEGSEPVLKGFTITGGSGNGIFCDSTSPVISNCIIEENGSNGIYSIRASEPTIRDNIIRDNNGRGVYVGLSTATGSYAATIQNNEIYGNSGYGIYIFVPSGTGVESPAIENNKIYGNSTYGIYGYNVSTTTSKLTPTIKNNWIYENGDTGVRTRNGLAQVLNSTIYGHTSKGIHHISSGSTTITNCIVWNNNDDLYDCSATYSCIEDPCDVGGTGNISSYPYFKDYANDDFHLTWNSPCINRGDPCGSYTGQTDIDGEDRVADEEYVNERVDMGADELNLSTGEPVYLPPYGWANGDDVKSVKFGAGGVNEDWISGTITDYMSNPCSDPNDSNITYRELYAGKTITIEFPKFNVGEPNFPLTPMLLEIMYKDTVANEYPSTIGSYDLVYAYSKIDFIDLDPDYDRSSNRDYGIAQMGRFQDYDWKYIQYGFQVSDFQLLRAIDGKFTIKIKNSTTWILPSYSLPIDYVSLRKITQSEYEALTNKQREGAGFYEVDLPGDWPADPSYNDPNLVVFVRDPMRPVYRHTKPKATEIEQDIVGFSCWGEFEPLSFSIYSEFGIEDLTVSVSDLAHEDGDPCDVIYSNEIEVYHVVYDESRFTYSTRAGYGLIGDRIEEFTSLDIDPNTSERIWLKVHVPDEGEDLSSGLYEGQVIISRTGEPNEIVDIKFTVYDMTLDQSGAIQYVYSDPYEGFSDIHVHVFSEDLDEVFRVYRETGFDGRIGSTTHRIYAYDDGGGVAFNTNNFKVAFKRAIDEGFIKDTASVYIPDALYKEVYTCSTGVDLAVTDPCLWSDLSDPNFVDAFGSLIETYMEIADGDDVTFIFQVRDEPGVNKTNRIIVDRLYTIIHNVNGLTSQTYYDNCDDSVAVDPCDPCDYIVPDNTIPPLTELVDYKVWNPWYIDDGYYKHNNQSGYHGFFGYYTTGHSHYRNPVYNRFLHGLFALDTDCTIIGAYAMGALINDPFNNFDSHGIHLYPFTYPDFMYAYPTWSGKLLSTMGGLEGIREGIKDAKYIATLKGLIADDPDRPIAQAAQDYLDEVKNRINYDYVTAYSGQKTELGYYAAILKDVSATDDDDDFEAFTEIRKKIAEYMIRLHSDPNNYTVHNTTKDIWYSSIQDAIDEASTSDVIKAYPRTYEENIDFKGKAITVQSSDPSNWDVAGSTIIDAGSASYGATFDLGEDENSVLSGFTIKNAGSLGGAYCNGTSPVISRCIFEDNADEGVYSSGGSPLIANNKIRGNDIGIRCTGGSTAEIKNNLIYENDDDGICLQDNDTDPYIYNNTIVDNSDYGIGKVGANPTPTISNCILWGNDDDLHSSFSATYSCIQDIDTGEGNILGDPNNPLFVDPNNGNYHLQLDSPCINSGDPCGTYIGETDIDGEPRIMRGRVDIGADEVRRVHNITQGTWYAWIQDAIDAASGGEEIVAYEDTYEENVDFDGKAITVRSGDPCDWDVVEATTINAGDSGYTVRFDSGEGSNSRLKGFTITRGGTYGVYCKNTDPYIQQCAITDNGSHGIYIRQTSSAYCIPTIKKNKIYDNGGRGIYGYGSVPSRLRPSIKNNWIYENGGYGIYTLIGTATVYNNTIVGNTSMGIRHNSSGSTTVKNCIVWANGNDLFGCSATYSCIQDIDSGAGNIVGDPNNPSFVDRNGPDDILGTADDNYRISSGSPCIDAANGNVDPPTDIFGQARIDDPNTPNTGIGNPDYVDIGACEYNPN